MGSVRRGCVSSVTAKQHSCKGTRDCGLGLGSESKEAETVSLDKPVCRNFFFVSSVWVCETESLQSRDNRVVINT